MSNDTAGITRSFLPLKVFRKLLKLINDIRNKKFAHANPWMC